MGSSTEAESGAENLRWVSNSIWVSNSKLHTIPLPIEIYEVLVCFVESGWPLPALNWSNLLPAHQPTVRPCYDHGYQFCEIGNAHILLTSVYSSKRWCDEIHVCNKFVALNK